MTDPTAKALAREIDERLDALKQTNTPAIRAVRREYSKRVRHAEPHVVVDLAVELQRYSGPGRRFLGYELVHAHAAALASVNARQLKRLGRGMSGWAQVDSFACIVAGQVWRAGQVSDAHIQGWARSKDRWWRRAAVVSTVPLNVAARGGHGDTPRTVAVCRLLVEDRDDMVVKSLSWALRELVAHDPKAVRNFLRTHEAVLAPRVLREVRNKLTTGLKNPRKET